MSSLFSKWWTRKSHSRQAKSMVRRRPIWPSRAHLLLEQLEGRVVPTGNINVSGLPGPIAATSGNTLTDQPVATFTYTSGPSDPSYYSATINWGDSLSSGGTIVYANPTDQANGVFTVEGSHTYALSGSYVVTVSVIEGPVHRYSFTTDASDSIGGANGTLMGDANISNGAVNLDGSTGTFVNLPAYILPTTGSVSLEAWGTYQAAGSWARIFDFGNINSNSAGANYLFLSPIPGGDPSSAYVSITNTDPGYIQDQHISIGGTNLDNGQLVQTDVVFDETNHVMQLYINGNLAGSAFLSVPLSQIVDNYSFLGRSLYAGDSYLNSSISEFRIYDTALTGADVTANYAAGPDTLIADSGVGSTTVSAPGGDAPLTATGVNITPTEGSSFSGVVASFTDADPSPSASDYSSTINWGDGATTPGNISQVLVKIYGGTQFSGSGTPYSDFIGSFTAPNVEFGNDSNQSWQPLGLSINFGADVTGVLEVASSGTYNFGLDSNDGSLLTIDNQLVVNNPDEHGPQTIGGSIFLTAGPHPFEIQFFQGPGTANLNLTLPAGVTYGSADVPGAFFVTGTHTYETGAPETVTTTINDAGGSSTSATSSAGVIPVAPLATITAPAHAAQGSNVTLNGSVSEAGTNDAVSSSWSAFENAADNALQLNGSGGYAVTPDLTAEFPSSTVTLGVWFNANGAGDIVDEIGQATPNTGWNDTQLEILGNGQVSARVWNSSPVTLGFVSFGTWHYAVLRYDGNTQTLDGFLDGNQSSSSVSVNRATPEQYGFAQYYALGAADGQNLGSGAAFNGEIDEFRVWNVALTNAQVTASMNQQLTGTEPGLVLNYRFDGGSGTAIPDQASDSTASGVLVPAAGLDPNATSPADPTDGAYQFSGGQIALNIPQLNTSVGTANTVSFWMNWNGGNLEMPIGFTSYNLFMYNGAFGFNTAQSDVYGISSDSVTNGWHFITAVFVNGDVTDSQLYVDGVEQSLTQQIGTTNNSLTIGSTQARISGWVNYSGFSFTGDLDEVAFFNRALTSAEVTAQYDAQGGTGYAATVLGQNPVAYYRLDDPADSTVAEDSSGNGNNGTVFGVASYALSSAPIGAAGVAPLATGTGSNFNFTLSDDNPLDIVLSAANQEGQTTTTFANVVTVTNTNDSGSGSLRQAILDADGAPGTNIIRFDIPASGIHEIQPLSPLPGLISSVELDGTTQPGYSGTPLIELNGAYAGGGADGLFLWASNITVAGIDINGFSNDGIDVYGGHDTIQSDYIGVDPTGEVAMGNGNNGIYVVTSNNVIGGPTSTAGTGAGNVISGNSHGIAMTASNNLVEGNLIGTDAMGSTTLGNGVGIDIVSSGNTIGGTSSQDRNVLSGGVFGVRFSGGGAFGNLVEENYFGTDITGTVALGNSIDGIALYGGAWGNTIGAVGAGNVFAASGLAGIEMSDGGTTQNIIQANLFGTDYTGTVSLGHQGNGLQLEDGVTYTMIGGALPGQGNLFSGNNGRGIYLGDRNSSHTIIEGNLIGTDITGTKAMPNGLSGIEANDGGFDTIGGASSIDSITGKLTGAGNLISGNDQNGVYLNGSSNDIVQGNFIGTDITGTLAVANFANGIYIGSGSTNIAIGGTAVGSGNVISGNGQPPPYYTDGIFVDTRGPTNILIAGNLIGTNATGTAAIGNGYDGIAVGTNVSGVTIGGTTTAARNIISGSGYNAGVEFYQSGPGNLVLGNFIGVDITGTQALGNAGWGVVIGDGSNGETIGGTTVGARNIISGNGNGMLFWSSGPGRDTTNNLVEGNYIGTDVSGSAIVGNAGYGVVMFSSCDGNTIGGTIAGAGNIISGNAGNGIELDGVFYNSVQGNFIGVDATGTRALANGGYGVLLNQGASSNTIGGSSYLDQTTGKLAGAGNLISGNSEGGILVQYGSNNVVQGNYISTDATGTSAIGNGSGDDSIDLNDGANGTIIGGVSTVDAFGNLSGLGNLLSGGSGDGIFMAVFNGPDNPITNSTIQGNYIGVDVTGTRGLGTGQVGIHIEGIATNTQIGGTTPGTGNVISDSGISGVTNYQQAIKIQSPSRAGLVTGTVIQGNFIGTDYTGTHALGNLGDGIELFATAASSLTGTVIGGATPGARNIVSGNHANGIEIQATTGTSVLVEGNYIGVDANGTVAIANHGSGVFLNGAGGVTIGGLTSAPGTGSGNLISGNSSDGIRITGPTATGNLIEGDLIGTNASGTAALANSGGVIFSAGASSNIVGGTTVGTRNVISGNANSGVDISGTGTSSNIVAGNFIGTDATGSVALGNGTVGVSLEDGATNNRIGADGSGVAVDAAARNVISGNALAGVALFGAGDANNVVAGNYIGVDVSGAIALPNGGEASAFQVTGSGVSIFGRASNNRIGASGNEIDNAGERNVISENDGTGVAISSSSVLGVGETGPTTGNLIGGNVIEFNSAAGVSVAGSAAAGNSIRGNSIFGNGALGIDLGQDGVTANDPGDADTGANNLQNYPVLTGAIAGATTSVSGTFNSTADSTFTLEFYASASADPSGYGQGQVYLGSTNVTTDDSGNATFVVTGLGLTTVGEAISATATDATGDTSEFSADVSAGSLMANAGGPYSSAEGGSLSLTGSGSDPLGISLTYTWTINGHANAATGASPSLTWPQLQALGIDDGPGSFAVDLTVSDAYGNSTTAATTLSLANTPPIASVSGPAIGVPGQPLSFTFGAADPSAIDQAAGFSFSINWGDGHTDSEAGLSGISDNHVYTSTGSYTITLTATDKDGGLSSSVTQTVTVAAVELEGTTLAVGGTTGNDSFVLTPVTASSMKVVLNGTNLGTFADTSLQLYGDGGTDTVSINGTSGDDSFTLAGTTAIVNAFTIGLNNMQSVTENGLAGNDSFTNTLAAIPSTLLGVGNNDTFAFAGGAMGASAIITGGAGTNSLIAPDMANLWTITGANAGTLNGDSFTGIQNVTGGVLADTFQMNAGGTLGGTLNGGGGSNSLDYSAYTTAVTANLQTGTATGIALGWSNLSSITGSSTAASTLSGPDSASTWVVNGSNSGSVNGFAFANFQNLTGGAGTNLFDFTGTGTIAGKLAGTGSNSLNYAGYGSPVTVNLQGKTATGIGTTWTSVVAFTGTGTTDTLLGPNAASAWSITGQNAGTVGIYSFSGFPNLTGGTGPNTFTVVAGGSLTGILTGTSTNNTLVGPAAVNTFAITGVNAGSLNATVIPSFVGIQSLTGGNQPNDFVLANGASLAGSIGGAGGVAIDESQVSTSVTASLQTNKITGVTGTVTNLVNVIGGNAANTLSGANTTNSWTISGVNSGTVNSVAFSNFGSLTGGTGADTFTVGTAGSLNGALAGGTGTNTLVGPNVASTFAITGTNAGNLNGSVIPAFTQIQNLVGGSSPNRFVFSAGAKVTGSVDGGAGVGTLDYSAYTTNVVVNLQTNIVTGVTGTATDINNVIGGSGTNTITGPNGGATWNLTGNNAGTINGTFSFSAFANLTTGTGANDFVLNNGAGVTGNINATAGTGMLDYSAYSFGVSVNLQSNVVTGVGSKATGLVSVIGGSGSNALTGANTANTWNITGTNAGNINGTVSFSAFATLTGGSGSDVFVFSAGAGVSGVITGKAGTNRLDYTGFGSSVYVNMLTAAATGTLGIANIQQVYGSGMGDVLVGNGTGVTLVESAGDNLIIGGTGGGATLDSGSGQDIVIAGSTIYDNNQAALEAIENFWATNSGSFSDRTAALAAGITGGFKLDSSTVTHHTGAADTIALNSALDWLFWRSSGTGADTVTGTPGQGKLI